MLKTIKNELASWWRQNTISSYPDNKMEKQQDLLTQLIEDNTAKQVGFPNKASAFGFVVKAFPLHVISESPSAHGEIVEAFYKLDLNYPNREDFRKGDGKFYEDSFSPTAFGFTFFVGFPLRHRESNLEKKSYAIELAKDISSKWQNRNHPLLIVIEASELFGNWMENPIRYHINGIALRQSKDAEAALAGTLKDVSENIIVTTNISVEHFQSNIIGELEFDAYEDVEKIFKLSL